MSGRPKSYQQFFAELKRRRVFRVMAAYGVIGFGIIEAAEAIFPRVALPDWTVTLVVWLTLLGFPIAVILAWAFDSTPEGVKRTEDATAEEIEAIVAEPASKRWSAGLLALAGVVLLFGGWWLGHRGGAGSGLSLAPAGAEAAGFHKIAVLPFDDLGGNEKNDPLLLGFHRNIIDKLMTLGDLRVTSPYSVRDYANSTKDSRQIAAELANVDYLLRGGVTQAGNQAQIHVWLVDVAADDEVSIEEWTGEVTVDNIFTIQSQIARRVADRLQAELSPQDIERLEAGLSTSDPGAINAYYRARSAWSNATLKTADELFEQADRIQPAIEQAVRLAPDFVEAWSLGAEFWSVLSRYGDEYRPKALQAVERTESLAPESIEAVKARAWYSFRVSEDFESALSLFRQAESMAPSDVDVLTSIAGIQSKRGDFAEGARTMRRAVFLDPQNAEAHVNLATLLQSRSMWAAADAVVERALAIDPSNERAQRLKLWLIAQGELDPELALDRMVEFGLDPRFEGVFFAMIARDYDAAARFAATWVTSDDEDDSLGTQFEMGRLLWLLYVERLRGGNSGAVSDSLASLLAGSPRFVASGYKFTRAEALIAVGREEGWTLLREYTQEARLEDDQARLVSIYWANARCYARYGRREEALASLTDAVGRPVSTVWSMADLELEPAFDSIRDDPRFDALLARQQAYEDEQARLAEAEGPWLPGAIAQ